MCLCTINKDVKRVFQYHGAEHKTIFCYEYGLELRVKYTTKGKKTTRHNGVASICAPDGFIASQGVSQFPVSKKKGDTAYIRYIFPDFFRTLYTREEGIPTGQYTVKLYLDGQAFLETAFTLKK